MRELARAAVLAALMAPLTHAQYGRHNFRFGMGGALPRADLHGLFSESFALNVGYGYRFHRNFQVDAGFETVFGAADVRDYIESIFGPLRIRDYQFFVPVGGRVVLPLARERVQLHGGGGVAYMRYSEMLRQPSEEFRLECPDCATRHGVGYYAQTGASFALDRRQYFRLGLTGRVYRGRTDGMRLGLAPPFETRDHWVSVFGEFTVNF